MAANRDRSGKPMTKTVIRKVSPNVKVIVPGSKPRTQSATEKAAIAAKAKTKTPAVRAKAAAEKKSNVRYNKREEARMRIMVTDQAYREGLKSSGYATPKPGTGMGPAPTAAQVKAANKAAAEAERKFKAGLEKAKARKTSRVGRGGMRGGSGLAGNLNDLNR
jgi:hypothetical protein